MSKEIDVTKITTDEERDAIHIAVIPVVAGENLERADWIKITYSEYTEKYIAYKTEEIDANAIVSPFIFYVKKNEKFYAFMRPETVSNLRHNWSHKDFQDYDYETGYSDGYSSDDGCRGC